MGNLIGTPPAKTEKTPQEEVKRLHIRRLSLYVIARLVLTHVHFQFLTYNLRQGWKWGWFPLVVYRFLRCCAMLLTFFLQKASVWGCFKSWFDLAFGWLVPRGTLAWVSVLLVVMAQGLSVASRYRCMFGGVDQPSVRTFLFAAHAVAGLLVSGAFLSRAGGPGGEGIYNACEWRHHGTAVVLAGVVSSLLDAWVYDQRGYQSMHGLGVFRRPPPRGRKTHLVLSRGYDQQLLDLHYYVPGSEEEEELMLEEDVLSRRRSPHSRMLLPRLPPQAKLPSFVSPHASKGVRWVGRQVMRLWIYWENLQGEELLSRVVLVALGVALLVWPVEGCLRGVGSMVFGEDHHYENLPPSVGSSWQALPMVGWTTLLVLWYISFSLAESTLLLCHLVRQPVDFSGFEAGVGGVGVLQYWLEKGWTVLLRDPRQQQQHLEQYGGGGSRRRSGGAAVPAAAAAGGEEMWQVEMEDAQRVLYRVAVLENKSVFPPRLETHSQLARQRVTVTEKLYRAHAFLDLAILAHTNGERRREVCFREMLRWRDACRPLLMVVNALTLQLELQMEGGGRLEGGMASPLKNLHTRLGLVEPREGRGVAALIIDSEVQKRMEEVWARRRRQGMVVTVEEMQEARSEDFLLPARLVGGMGGRRGGGEEQLLSPLALPTLDLQVVELAASALGGLYRHAVEVVEEGEGGREGGFEDSRGCSRHSIPAVIGSLVSCQLALHLYSTMVLCKGGEEEGGGGRTRKGGVPRFQVILERPSVVLPQLVGVSLAVDEAIEGIVERYYDSDFGTFCFAPLYARCVKMYVECGRRKGGEGGREGGREEEVVGGMGVGEKGSPSLLRRRRG